MMEVIDREAFRAHFDWLHAGMGDDDSPLWIPEQDRAPSKWFMFVPQGGWDSDDFWPWCRQHCQGHVLCYSASEDGAWWGFECQEDMVLWSLKWVG